MIPHGSRKIPKSDISFKKQEHVRLLRLNRSLVSSLESIERSLRAKVAEIQLKVDSMSPVGKAKTEAVHASNKLQAHLEDPVLLSQKDRLVDLRNALAVARSVNQLSENAQFYLHARRLFEAKTYSSSPTALSTDLLPDNIRRQVAAGIALAGIQQIGLPMGIGLMAYTGLSDAISHKGIRWEFGGAGFGCIAASMACYFTPDNYKLRSWKNLVVRRTGVSEEREIGHIHAAIDKMVLSYAAPINAAIALGLGLGLSGTGDVAAKTIAVSISAVVLVLTYFSISGNRRKILQPVSVLAMLSSAVVVSAVLLARASSQASDRLPGGVEDEGTFDGSIAFPTASAFFTSLSFLQSFLALRNEIVEARSEIDADLIRHKISKAEKELTSAENHHMLRDEKRLTTWAERAQSSLFEAEAAWHQEKSGLIVMRDTLLNEKEKISAELREIRAVTSEMKELDFDTKERPRRTTL